MVKNITKSVKKSKPENDTCAVEYVDREKVERVQEQMPSGKIFYEVSELFKALGDPNRCRIIFALAREELCVCDLANLLNMSNSAVSHQLRYLRHLRLVKYRRQGKRAFYLLDDEHINNLFYQGLEHIKEP